MANVNPYTSDVYIDMMQYETERDIERIKKRLAAEYKQAEKELKQIWAKYTKRFAVQDKEKAKQVKNGVLSEDDYLKWRAKEVVNNNMLGQQVDRMADYIANVDQQSADIVNGKRYGVYANNYNYARYEVEKGFNIDTSFSLFDQKTVERLAKDNPKMLPTMKPDKIKGKKWSKRAINNAISQGVLQGKPLPEVAKNLEKVVGMEWNSAVRNARTAMTGAQNAGRVASYMDAEKLGINLQKQWMATLDERTRSSHASLDGESVPVDKKFSNGLMFPADPEGKPAEVYNCRCTLVADLIDYPKDNFQRYDNIEGKPIDYVTFEEWSKAKSNQTTNEALFNRNNITWSENGRLLKNALEASNVEYRPVKNLSKELNENEIIEKIGGGDKTKGSCISLCYAYAGNKLGLDVIDYRGGKSREVMSYSMYNVPKLNGVISKIVSGGGVRGANKLINIIEESKEYILGTGRHAAVIRKTKAGKIEYLELQTNNNNGWHELTSEVLKSRFACASSYKARQSELIDINSLRESDEFRDLLGYINTAKDMQKKGSGGIAK